MAGGLPLWIPIVSAVGSLGVGAFVGAAVTHLFRERADQKREDRERDGLLRLISIEMQHNKGFLWSMRIDLSKIEPGLEDEALVGIGLLKMDAWESARVRLAQLLPSKIFNSLAEYYSGLQSTIAVRTSLKRSLAGPKTTILNHLDSTEDARKAANAAVASYLGAGVRDNSAAPWEDTESTAPER